jgi:hypothetical protein
VLALLGGLNLGLCPSYIYYLMHAAMSCAVQELGRSPFPVVRNNIMVALSDMLIQYTALVDAHMPRLAGCIRWVRLHFSWSAMPFFAEASQAGGPHIRPCKPAKHHRVTEYTNSMVVHKGGI